ncbi:MAG: hypothetical protein KAW12_11435 [Candidatus Aminicenantes bacterium]|nr:hypothetical protein [Candidatus Aminicenantes bacterium]
MDFVREILEPDRLNGIINIPEKLRQAPVEVIILPAPGTNAGTENRGVRQREKYKKLYENPIKVKKIKTFSREELHER